MFTAQLANVYKFVIYIMIYTMIYNKYLFIHMLESINAQNSKATTTQRKQNGVQMTKLRIDL